MKIRIAIYFIFTIILFCQSKCRVTKPSTIDSNKSFAITSVYIIDGTGLGDPFRGVVIVESGKIKAVGSEGEINIPSDMLTIDADGAFLLPGFFNTHVHNGFIQSNLEAWAQAGVTTIRDLGVQYSVFKNQRPPNDTNIARLLAAGPVLTTPGGYPLVPWGSPIGYYVLSPQDGIDKVNKLIDEGADIIKIILESGTAFNLTIPMLSPQEASAIVKTAHQRNRRVSAHVLVSDDLKAALDAGVDDIAHMITDDISDDIIERMIRQGVYWVPTLELWNAVESSLVARAKNNLTKYINAGGLVALGTDFDGYNSPFDLGMPVTEINLMREAGMTAMQIIVAATRNAAIVCGVEQELGTIKAGKIADILVIRGNPLSDLDNLLDVLLVIHNGVIIKDNRYR
ncbi:MAG: amidohydrolase family protein [Candidatus Aminicenantes bacterium]|nr:amidohydrolase family protein [Candidatus Aminicenantes bacterium]NIM81115.1 amidohydrolase family protein [Candidatus Aminicenantes bacterium]NIN20489.1 amidohydrolase family protein [Candidatus Aminicenantes bacterium]NIN44262.1 amidohydrolase family protein [Candidatus Aminicenantes bacterium]NIN87081.1 amidohydrolase family protein [Candidatus Aminicenantes bacterium]